MTTQTYEPLLTPEFRACYAFVFTTQENKQDDGTIKKEYSVSAVFAKGTDLSGLKLAAAKLMSDKFGTDQSKWPTPIRTPFRACRERWKMVNGVQQIPAGYEDGDAIFITLKANEKRRPGVVDQDVQPIIEPHQFYSGCYARASVNPYYYERKGNKGIAFGLNNIQKTRDGDPLGGRANPEKDFVPVAKPAGAAAGASATNLFG